MYLTGLQFGFCVGRLWLGAEVLGMPAEGQLIAISGLFTLLVFLYLALIQEYKFSH